MLEANLLWQNKTKTHTYKQTHTQADRQNNTNLILDDYVGNIIIRMIVVVLSKWVKLREEEERWKKAKKEIVHFWRAAACGISF